MEAQQIYARIHEATRPAELPATWRSFRGDTNVRRLQTDPHVLAANLEKEFGVPALLKCGVYRGTDSRHSLSPVIADQQSLLLFLRAKEDGPPIDVVSGAGALRSNAPPCFDCTDDGWTQAKAGDTKIILIAATAGALSVARALGLPATLGAGLANMTSGQFKGLFTKVGIGHPTPPPNISVPAVTKGGYRCVLIAWQLESLGQQFPVEAAKIAERLVRGERAYNRETAARLGVWAPSATHLELIRDGVEFGDGPLVRRTIW